MVKNPIRPDSPEQFPSLNESWFRSHGFDLQRAAQLAREWKGWLSIRKRVTRRGLYRKALELTAGVHAGSVAHYISDEFWQKLGEDTIRRMDAISLELGFDPPQRSEPRQRVRGTHRIALLAELGGVPSPRYHLEVIRSIIHAASAARLEVSIHELSQGDSKMKAALARIVRNNHPHGLIWLRLTPDWASREFAWSKLLPVVIVHGDRLGDYTRPVLGHIVPSQKPIQQAIKQWARDLRVASASREIVVATMQREHSASSIRNERVDLTKAGLREAGFTPREFFVPEYSASNALAILETHPRAAGFVCLSDEIAIAIKQLLLFKGCKNAGRMVLGFDDSPLAAKHGIWSFSQHLDEIGNRVRDLLTGFFEHRATNPNHWPEFQEVPVEVNLTPRE